MEKNKVRLTIGGLDYRLTTDGDVNYIKNLAEEVDEIMTDLMQNHSKLSQVQAAVLCALDYADRYHQAERNADYLKAQIQVYMEDAARAKTEAEMARREAERMTRDLRSIRRSLEEKDQL
ncbi:MAG: cell division protein ZapA [Clostridia bacterium]|nr:cell division protein ZapA [Clostridia bacterium]